MSTRKIPQDWRPGPYVKPELPGNVVEVFHAPPGPEDPTREYHRRTERCPTGLVEEAVDSGRMDISAELVLTKGLVRRLLEYLRTGLGLERAATACAIPPAVWRGWLSEGDVRLQAGEYGHQLSRLVLLLRAAEAEAELEAAHAVNRRQRNWAAAAWWLSRRHAVRWGSVSGVVGGVEEPVHLRRTLTVHGEVPSGKRVAFPEVGGGVVSGVGLGAGRGVPGGGLDEDDGLMSNGRWVNERPVEGEMWAHSRVVTSEELGLVDGEGGVE